jgi:serine/threonine-protein kinase
MPHAICEQTSLHPSLRGLVVNDDPRVYALLDELQESGGTPEEACRSCPELLPLVRARWARLKVLERELESMFPSSDSGQGRTPTHVAGQQQPTIRGYEIYGVLGRGGVGVVYKALHLRLNRPVALKMLLAGGYARYEDVERFLHESEAVASLHHPNIVQVYDAGEVEGRPYFTMELVEGASLAHKLKGTPFPARQGAILVAIVAEAIQAAHQCGIVHRDLKPGNVLLTLQGAPKVTDFGLARRLEGGAGLTLTGAPLGTPSYMAPEQARGDSGAIGTATDVYAMGAILYELLTGRPPFRGETATATLRQVVFDEPVSPGQLNPAVPRDLQTICLKCLEKDPRRRYASAQSLADDLRRFERGEPILARPAGLLERTAKWARRRPAAAALLAAATLALACAGAAAVWFVGDRARLRAEARSRDHEAKLALDQAELHLKDLRTKLDDPFKVRELLSEIDHWQAMVQQARQNWQQAVSASVGDEVRVAAKTRARIQAVEAVVVREEAAYRLARDLDNIAVEALASSDARASQMKKGAVRYERLFSTQGMDIQKPGTAWFGSAIRSSPARFALIAALDNWAWLAGNNAALDRMRILTRQGVDARKALIAGITEDPQLARVLELARVGDPDPWRDRFRDPAVWTNRAALTQLADDPEVGRQSPTVLTSLAWWLATSDGDPTSLYARVLVDHPRDFWLHLHAAMNAKDPGLRVGLAQAAIAIRPGNAKGYYQLARGLQERGDWLESLVAVNRAIEINPSYAWSYYLQGCALRHKENLPGAVAAFQRAIDLDPGNHLPRHGLGQVLQQQGRYAEAEQAYLGAIQAQPTVFSSYHFLAWLLATCPNDNVRDGKRAVEYATSACERSNWKDPLCLDVLAAAYAEAGQFEKAVRYQTRVVDDAALKGDLRTAARQRLELYKQKKAFREAGERP